MLYVIMTGSEIRKKAVIGRFFHFIYTLKFFLKFFFTECIVSGIRYSASEGPTIDSFNLVSPEGNGANRYQSTCH